MPRSICAVEACDKIVVSHGYCSKHWTRLKRTGSLEATVLRGATAEIRYLSKIVVPEDPDACWGWLGGLTPEGYGRFMWDLPDGGRGQLAHRFGWEQHHGPIPAGSVIDHACHDPRSCADGRACPHRSCQNPAHWMLATPLANTATDRRRTNADKTHCKWGHEFTPENTYVNMRNGRPNRHCRTCQARRDRASRKRK